MAQDIDMTTPEDKGKGKASDAPNDEKPVLNGKKEEDKADGMFHWFGPDSCEMQPPRLANMPSILFFYILT